VCACSWSLSLSIKTRETKSGTRYQVRYRDPLGRQVSRQFATKRAAVAFENTEASAIAQGAWIDPRSQEVTFSDWAQQWLHSNPGKRETTFARDEVIIRRHLETAFKNKRLNQIQPTEVQFLVNKWSGTFAPHTVQRQYRTLAAIFRAAVICDLLAKSPCRGIKLPRLPNRKAISVDGRGLQLLTTHLGDYALMAYLGAVAGLRWGEVAGLRVSDLDILQCKIRIAQQVSRDKYGRSILSTPKTTAGIRTMGIPPELADELAAYLRRHNWNASYECQLLFTDSHGGLLRHSNWTRRVWKPACDAANLPSLGFHDLRRANATAMVASGVDIKTAQTRLGHSDPRMTLAIYAQATSQGDSDAATCLGEVFLSPAQLDATK
jgi:integrase